MSSFTAQISEWCRETEERMERVFQVAVGDLGTELTKPRPEGRVPHVTGNLMRSLLGSTSTVTTGPPGARYAGTDVGAFAATLKLGQTAYLGYQANYARRVNFGFVGPDSLGRVYNQSGAHFVEAAIAKWHEIVNNACLKVKGNA